MPRLSLWRDTHTADYKFQDRRIYELFTAGGTNFNVHKYLGINDQGTSTDVTLPQYTNTTEKDIQDLLFLENRDRKYDRNIYPVRGHYTIQDTDFNLSQFGLFVTNDTLFLTFHINDMIERMGRKLIPGDVLEFQHLRDYNPLDPNDVIPIALKKFYVVQETTRAAEGFAPTWWPHLWRAKVQPMVDGQEYRDILEQPDNREDGMGGTGINPLKDYLSTYAKNVNINDRIIEQAQIDVPFSGYDTTALWILATDANGNPVASNGLTADTIYLAGDSNAVTADVAWQSPQNGVPGYLVGDGVTPNGLPVKAQTYFTDVPQTGDYVLRTDYFPNRLFRYDGMKWVAIEDNQRALLNSDQNNTLKGGFFNNTKQTRLSGGGYIDQRVALSQALKVKADG